MKFMTSEWLRAAELDLMTIEAIKDNEHPPKHIHIKYGDHEAAMELQNLNIIDGSLPKKCRQLVREWAEMHQDELLQMWETQNFHKIEPLE